MNKLSITFIYTAFATA